MLERSLEATVNEVLAGIVSVSYCDLFLFLGRRKGGRLGLSDYDEGS